MTLGVRSKLFLVSVALILGAGLVGGLYLEHALRRWFEANLETELLRYTKVARDMLELSTDASLLQQADRLADRLGRSLSARVTIVDQDGTVLGDSLLDDAALQTVENHRDHQEIAQALLQGQGMARRYSKTSQKDMFYAAITYKHLTEQGVIRVGMPLRDVEQTVASLRWLLCFAGLCGLITAVFMSVLASHYASRHLRDLVKHAHRVVQGEEHSHLAIVSADEIGGIAGSFNQLSDKLKQAITELRRLETIRRDFVANVSHELRTPVSVIRANAETLLDGALDDKERARGFVEALFRNAERLGRLVSDLLDISRIEAGQIKLNIEKVKLALAVQRAVEAVHLTAEQKRLVIEFPIPSDLYVNADQQALDQILLNLIDNAVKYTPKGGKIVIRAQAAAESVRIEIVDNGPGIEKQHHTRIFERFYRVEPGRSREIGGTGLGLSIVKHLTEAMGGRVGVESISPHGSVFWFTLGL